MKDGELVLIETGEYELSGRNVLITASDLYTAISDGTKTHYFLRETGEYDGYGRDVRDDE